MNSSLVKLYVKLQGLKNGEEGQDLVEYALLVALIALVCITGVNNVATAVNTVFTNISSSLGLSRSGFFRFTKGLPASLWEELRGGPTSQSVSSPTCGKLCYHFLLFIGADKLTGMTLDIALPG